MELINFNYLRHWVVLLIFNLNISTILAEPTNVTIDDQDASIIYAPPGAWGHVTNGTSLDFGGAHMLTSDLAGTATFTFTGIAIYFMSPLWPDTVTTAISLDSRPSTLLNLTDPHPPSNAGISETVKSQIVWKATGLANTQHKLLISVGAGQDYAIVDGLTYTIDVTTSSSLASISLASTLPQLVSSTSTLLHPASSISTLPHLVSSISTLSHPASSTSTSNPIIPSSTATANTTPVSFLKSNSPSTLAITLGSVFGVIGLLVILSALWYLFRRRKRTPSQTSIIDGSANTLSMSAVSSVSAIRPNVVNNNGNWTGNQVDNYRYHMIQSNDGQNTHYDNVGIPLSQRYDTASSYGGIQSNNLQQPPLNYYPNISSYDGLPSTSSANQAGPSIPQPPLTPLRPQRRLSTPSTMSDNLLVYARDSATSPDPSMVLDGSMTVASSSRNGNTIEKSRNYGPSPRISRNTRIPFSDRADPEDALILTVIPEGNETIQEGSEARNSAWDSGYPQPLRFVPII